MNKYACWASRDTYSEIVGNGGDTLVPRGSEGELYKINKGDTYPRREEGEGKQSQQLACSHDRALQQASRNCILM